MKDITRANPSSDPMLWVVLGGLIGLAVSMALAAVVVLVGGKWATEEWAGLLIVLSPFLAVVGAIAGLRLGELLGKLPQDRAPRGISPEVEKVARERFFEVELAEEGEPAPDQRREVRKGEG